MMYAVNTNKTFCIEKTAWKSYFATRLMYLFVFCLSYWGCKSGPERLPAYYDFIDNFHLSDVRHEVSLIDFGTPSARRHMRGGWWGDEGSGDATLVWGFGQSALQIFITEPRNLKMEFRCLPFESPGRTQVISVKVNGKEVEQVTLEQGLKKYQILLPGHVLEIGENRIEFHYAYSQIPKNVIPGSGDVRQLAVFWDYIRFGTGSEHEQSGPEPWVNAETGELYIPFGAQVDYYLQLPAESILIFDELVFEGKQEGQLYLTLQRDGEEEEIVRTFPASTEFQAITLSSERISQIVRLSFRSVSTNEISTDSKGVKLVNPSIRTQHTQEAQLSSRRPNIIIYLIDALRADHLGCYGYEKPISPNIDEFAKDAILFEDAVAQSFWTKPTVASILTGLGPDAHGVRSMDDALPAEATTLPEILRASGYYTASFATNAVVGNILQLDHGFLDYIDLSNAKDAIIYHQLSDQVNKSVFDWLEKEHEYPYFLYIHTLDPHGPYAPPHKFRERFAASVSHPEIGSPSILPRLGKKEIPVTKTLIKDLVSLYDAEIAFNDHNFGIFLKELKRRGIYEDALIIFLADHGEEFYEHGSWEHGTLNAEVQNIPLIVKLPFSKGSKKGRSSHLAQQIDILPTISDYLGVNIPHNVEGKSLLDLFASGNEEKQLRRAFSGSRYNVRKQVSVIEGKWKLIHKPKTGARDSIVELYNRVQDPQEAVNVTEEYPEVADHLLSLIENHERLSIKQSKPSKAIIDEELEKKLKALGYLK